ncbi:Z protein [Parana virus]|uniref:RING finger protein Z n=1 Tax=Parana mammarenavirus (isolate Rat/Paraguay/12056/1965) TaxID=3052323 RepID=Z_PARVP|nr:Z protein [Parana virus]B2MW50.1 RecName: Full=RING finger protein Z; Short=Protein Z; AltName: Full=Zinc-binding protein [Mammarenavirus paranaense]ACC94301.1 Z protein [Parana virus]
MGLRYSKAVKDKYGDREIEGRATMTLNLPQGLYGRFNCKRCWFATKGLIACSDHYLCLNCLTIMLSDGNFCEVCGKTLPKKIVFEESPSAPPYDG